MSRKMYNIVVLFGMAAVLFCWAKGSVGEDNSGETVLENDIATASEAVEIEWMEEEPEEAIEIEKSTETAEPEISEAEEVELSLHYGVYRITEFCPTRYYSVLDRDVMPKQEADMLVGQKIVIKPEIFSVYDTKRWFQSANNDFHFLYNYMIQRYVEEKPKYRWLEIFDLEGEMEFMLKPDDTMRGAVGADYFDQLEGVMIAPALGSSDGIKPQMAEYYFYTIKGNADRLIMYSGRTLQYFLLERCGEGEVSEETQQQWSDRESRELLQGIYGEYQVSQFLPTKFFPASDGVCDVLPAEEASLMIGKGVTISERVFTTYDNYRMPTSATARRLADDFWIKKKEIEQPDYQIRTVSRDEIYGIRDGMLPDDFIQQEYVEISVYPGYEVNDGCKYLPQMYLAGEGKILILAMGEYFLLERTGRLGENHGEASGNVPDLSDWVGDYAFSEESGDVKTRKWIKIDDNDSYHKVEVSRNYRIEVMENDGGEYDAFITIQEEGNEPEVKILADVCGSRETVSFVFKEYISGELSWFDRNSDVLLSIRKDGDTGGLITHWGGLNYGREPGNHFVKE